MAKQTHIGNRRRKIGKKLAGDRVGVGGRKRVRGWRAYRKSREGQM